MLHERGLRSRPRLMRTAANSSTFPEDSSPAAGGAGRTGRRILKSIRGLQIESLNKRLFLLQKPNNLTITLQ